MDIRKLLTLGLAATLAGNALAHHSNTDRKSVV